MTCCVLAGPVDKETYEWVTDGNDAVEVKNAKHVVNG